MSSRRTRVVAGVFGILVGLAGLANILMERQAAKKRERMLTMLADDFRRRNQESPPPATEGSVVWEGQTFRPNDRVRITKWAGTFKPSETGAQVEVDAGQGQVGVVVRGEPRKSTDYLRIDPAEPVQIVRVRWPAQQWKENGSERRLDLPEFETTIHVSYLQVTR